MRFARVDVQGRYKSVMVVVTSCRSDMSSKGLSPHGHLCDGRLHLVLVHASSRLQYLRFLASIPRDGASQVRMGHCCQLPLCTGPHKHGPMLSCRAVIDE